MTADAELSRVSLGLVCVAMEVEVAAALWMRSIAAFVGDRECMAGRSSVRLATDTTGTSAAAKDSQEDAEMEVLDEDAMAAPFCRCVQAVQISALQGMFAIPGWQDHVAVMLWQAAQQV